MSKDSTTLAQKMSQTTFLIVSFINAYGRQWHIQDWVEVVGCVETSVERGLVGCVGARMCTLDQYSLPHSSRAAESNSPEE